MQRATDNALLKLTRRLGIFRGISTTAPMIGALATSYVIYDSFPSGGGERYAIYFALMGRRSNAIVPAALSILFALLNHWVYQSFLAQRDSFRTS
jgi:biopolymer transport protein ExbB/TolQ